MVHQVYALLDEVLLKLPGMRSHGMVYAVDVTLPEVKPNPILLINALVYLTDKGASIQWEHAIILLITFTFSCSCF